MDAQVIDYNTTTEIRHAISSIGRTEDIKFSADGSLLAITGFTENKVHLFEIDIERREQAPSIKITKCTTIVSEQLRRPHGITFLGKEYFVVANRSGDLNLFKCPSETSIISEVELMPLATFKGWRYFGIIWSPGSVDAYKIGEDSYRVLVCNNYVHTVVSFTIKLGDKIRIRSNGILTRRGLAIPDGISISPNRRWVAVSNHEIGCVMIYRLTAKLNWITAYLGTVLNRFIPPVGKLTGLAHPHGLRFSEDGNKIIVADAGTHNLYIYQNRNDDWHGEFKPDKSIAVLDEMTCLMEENAGERGIKGIDFANGILATTREDHVLSFYNMNELLNASSGEIDTICSNKNEHIAKRHTI